MKITKYILSIFLIGLISCEDFLENPPLGRLSSANFPETPEDARLATNGIYNVLREWNLHAGGFPILDIMSDDASKGSNPGDQLPTIGPFEEFTFDATSSSIERWWATLYQGINRSLLVIKGIPGINMNDELKNRYLAEARFLRAYFYFTLVRTWGDVPLVDEVNPPRRLPRTPKEQIYEEVIIPDLRFAIEQLPEKSEYEDSQMGRIVQGKLCYGCSICTGGN